jgi:phage tail-like protein
MVVNTMTDNQLNAKPDRGPLTIDHVADTCRPYPGEMVTFYTRVNVWQPLPGFTLRVTIPAQMGLGDYRALSQDSHPLPQVIYDAGAHHLAWDVAEELGAGTRREYQIQAQVAATQHDTILESQAVVTAHGTETISVGESAAIAVSAKSRYLRYLPALYESDELMGRFLMLFESFWAPIEEQICNLPLYLDPMMTPPEFLPWLASWLNLALDQRLPEERQRWLVRSAVRLYRKRGTREGLQEYLEIYTGERPEIIEHRAKDFRLGPDARLGPGIALGTGNRPHTFTVTLRLPPVSSPAEDEGERVRQELERRRTIEALIEAEKPAHTHYNLRIESVKGRQS